MSSPHPIDTKGRRTGSHPDEAGFMLVFVILLTSLLLIALAVAAPIVANQIRRDKEVESEHRAQQYVRGIRLYYRKLKTYPPSVDALEKTNDIRFLRKRYVDPLTGKDDWRIIHLGEQQTTVKGFFGKPLGGLNTKGAGGLGSASTLGSGFGGAASPTTGSSTAGTTTPSTTVTSTSPLSAGLGGATIGGSSTPGTSTPGSSGITSVGQIVGVGTAKTGNSILNPNGQTTYDTWEFIYDPKIELLYAASSLTGGQVTSQPASSFGSDAASGKSNSGSSNTPTSTPTTPTSPLNSNP